MTHSTFHRVIRSKVLWTMWACLPVAALAWAFGPGQAAMDRDRASRLIESARVAEVLAESTQAAAHTAHRAALAARKHAEQTRDPADFAQAEAARAAEDAAYIVAAESWKAVAQPLSEASTLLEGIGDPRTEEIRVARARALIRGGELLEGVVELEAVIDELSQPSEPGAPLQEPARAALAEQARHELGSGLYFGARLLRHAGAPAEEWGAVATAARRQFRYLAESAHGEGSQPTERFAEHQHNVELALDLEQASYEEVIGRPLPKQCPGAGNCKNQCKGLAGHCKGKGKGKRKQPKPPSDSRQQGAGNNDFEEGW